MDFYCEKCKKKVTDTNSLQKVIINNNINMLKGRYIDCKFVKTRFLAKDDVKGTGIVINFINKLLFEFLLPCHNSTWPGANLN